MAGAADNLHERVNSRFKIIESGKAKMTNQERAMSNEKSLADDEKNTIEDDGRVAAKGEADEPDAPTAEEENEGMSTILSADPILGVQDNASEE
jgi:hypothetical protein